MELIKRLADPSTLTIGEKISGGLMVAAIGMTITFLALVFLWLMVVIMAKLLKQKQPVVSSPLAATVESTTDNKDDGVSDDVEIAAVITAALAAALQTPIDNIVVKRIVRVPDQRPAWSKSGLVEQMNNRF